MPERRRRDFLTPLLLALAADPAAGVLGLQALHPGLLGGGVRRAAARAGPEAPRRGARRPAHARVRDPGAADDGRDPGAGAHVAVPARAPDGALPRLGEAPAAARARGDAALLGASCRAATRASRAGSPSCRRRSRPSLAGGISQLAGGANGLLQNVLGRVTHAAIDLGLFLLMLFFLLRDGGRLKAELRPVSPFSDEQERQIFDHLDRTIKGALQAVVVVPVVQGILAGIGFLMFGVPSPLRVGHGRDPGGHGAARSARRSPGCPRASTWRSRARRVPRSGCSSTARWS